MSKISLRFLVCWAALLLVACGGGGDDGTIDDQAILAGVKVCELKQFTGSGLNPRFHLRTNQDDTIPGVGGPMYLLKPIVKVSEDWVFTIGLNFPVSAPQPEARRYSFYVQEWLYHTGGDVPRYQCVLNDLQSGDTVVLAGGKESYTRLFFVEVRAEFQLSDGRIVASKSEYLYIDY
jgi:hypothetical protein